MQKGGRAPVSSSFMGHQHREKIRVSVILDRVHQHAEGKLEMSQTELRAAEILLRKVLPDLQATELAADVSTRPVTFETVYESGPQQIEDRREQAIEILADQETVGEA